MSFGRQQESALTEYRREDKKEIAGMPFSQYSLSQRNVHSRKCKNRFEFFNLMNEQFGLISIICLHSCAQLHQSWKRQHPFAKHPK